MERTATEIYLDSGFLENAAHEAAHAVIGHVLGLEVKSIEVYQNTEEGGGSVEFADHDEREERAAIMTAAGGAAVGIMQTRLREQARRARWVGDVEGSDHVPTQWPDLSEDDKRAVARYLTGNYFSGGPNRTREYNRIVAEARRAVDDQWEAITAVMHALVDAGVDEPGDSRSKIDRAAFLKAIEGKIKQ